MLRVRANKGVVSKRASSKRTRAKNTRRHNVTVIEIPKAVVERKCYACSTILRCNVTPIPASLGLKVIIPAFNAPLICLECRKDKKKLYLVRKAMFKFFNWEEETLRVDR